MTDEELLLTDTVEALERRARGLEGRARYIAADDYACLHGLWPEKERCEAMARRMLDRIAELENGK